MRECHPAKTPRFGGTVVLASLLLSLALSANAVNAQTPHPPAKNVTKAAAHEKYDPRDFRGVWKLSREVKLSFPLTAEYQAILDQRMADADAGRPYQAAKDTCLPWGLVGAMTRAAHPIEIFYQKGEKEILIQRENIGDLYRIYIDRPHRSADELYPMFYGDSVAHWEGDVLVVDSISLGGSESFDLIGTPHSDALHVIQRFRRVSSDTLEDQITIEDPKALKHPITGTGIFKYRPDIELEEYQCSNERFYTDADGNQRVKPAAN
jgi:hypothetical protein